MAMELSFINKKTKEELIMTVNYKYSNLSSNLKNRILNNTGFFEGDNGYSQITGNFDGQGISFGIIQFNFGQGTLQSLLEDYIDDYKDEFYEIFGRTKGDKLKDVVKNYSKKDQIKWADSISTGKNNYSVKSEWKKAFEEMGESRNNIKIQKEYAKQYFVKALSYAEDFKIVTTQGLAFLFDQAVQEWSFEKGSSTIAKELRDSRYEYRHMEGEELPEKDALSIIYKYVKSSDGRARREAIMRGSGKVHGKRYDIDDFDLSYDEKID